MWPNACEERHPLHQPRRAAPGVHTCLPEVRSHEEMVHCPCSQQLLPKAWRSLRQHPQTAVGMVGTAALVALLIFSGTNGCFRGALDSGWITCGLGGGSCLLPISLLLPSKQRHASQEKDCSAFLFGTVSLIAIVMGALGGVGILPSYAPILGVWVSFTILAFAHNSLGTR